MNKSNIKPWYKVWWILGVIVLAVLMIIAIASSSNDKNASSRSTNTSKVTSNHKASNSESDVSSDTDSNDEGSSDATSEQENALDNAETYANTMHMSKKRIYAQLTSSYGNKFAASDAKYAVDHLTDVDWNNNALETAKTYVNTLHMSRNAVYGQLTSSYGDQFTASQAQYAVNHLK